MMTYFAVVATLALAIVANAGVVKREIRAPISVNIKNEGGLLSDIISEHNDLIVTLSLSQPIICEADEDDCRVVVLIHNSRPDELVLSACHVQWLKGQYEEPRNITVSTVENFVDDGERTFVLSTEVVSASNFYKGKSIPEIKIVTEPKNVATCSSTTDPNYNQWDGNSFLINTAGTFKLWQAPLRQWEVQARVNSKGFNCGVAVQDGCDRIVLDRCGGTLVRRKYSTATDGLSPKVTQSGITTTIASKRGGAIVEVTERVKISRAGRQVCGWSGCRIIYHTTRLDWLDIKLTAPGKDWGYLDNEVDPRTTGVCGLYDSNKNNDKKATQTWSQHVSSFKVQTSQTLFDKSYACPPKPTVAHDYSLCKVPPRPIQTPIVTTHDIEDITDLILTEQPDDKNDDRITYVFEDEDEFADNDKSPEFTAKVRDYCDHALTNTAAAELCERLGVELERFVQACVNDIVTQANATIFDLDSTDDDTHVLLAEANLEEMQGQCIAEGIRRRENIKLECSDEADCESVCLDQANSTSDTCEEAVCVGDCSIVIDNENLDQLIKSECPNACGNNTRINDTVAGKCVKNAEGKNKCDCNDGFAGEGCEIVIAQQPEISSLFPFVCDSSQAFCPPHIAVRGEEFYKTENVSCEITDGDTVHLMNATYLTSEIIRCALPDIDHTGAREKVVHIKLTLDGNVFSDALPFLYHDATCQQCSRTGYCGRRPGTCVIDNTCFNDGDVNPLDAGRCQVCDSDKAAADFSYVYNDPVCAPSLKRITSVRFLENQAVGTEIVDQFLPFRLEKNPYTEGDKDTKVEFSLGGADAEYFTMLTDGSLLLAKRPDYETKPSFEITVTATQGGLSDTMTVTIKAINVDDPAFFDKEIYTASVQENKLVADLLTVLATDPDKDAEFGEIRYSLRVNPVDSSALQYFSIDAVTGVISVVKSLDHEDLAERFFSVIAESGGAISAPVVVTVTNVNEAPTSIDLVEENSNLIVGAINENATVGDVVGRFVVHDQDVADAGAHTLTLIGTSNGRFELVGDLLVVKSGDFKLTAGSQRSFVVEVRATDAGLQSLDTEIVLVVTDGNDQPGIISLLSYDSSTATVGAALITVPEDQPAGIVGVLSVTDDDKFDTHTYTLVDEELLPFTIAGNELRLTDPLDYESLAGAKSYTLQIFATDDGVPPMDSDVQTFVLAVSDEDEVPGFFRFVPEFADGVPEGTLGDSYIGTVTALDQDSNQEFVIKQTVSHTDVTMINISRPLIIGDTTCYVDEHTNYTMCSAPVYLNEHAIDFESNRVTATTAFLTLDVYAVDVDTQAVGKGELQVAIANENDAPAGVVVESLIAGLGADGTVEVEDNQVTLPDVARLTPSDLDDSCPSTLEGCQAFVSTSLYSFQLTSRTTNYKLSAQCMTRMTLADRETTPCMLQNVGSLGAVGSSESVSVKVIDQDGESAITTFNVVVVPAVVRVNLDFTEISEFDVGADVNLGTMTISGWSESELPTITSSGAMTDMVEIVLLEERRQARATTAPRALVYEINRVSTYEIDFETLVPPTLTFAVNIAAIGGFAGLEFSQVIAVTNVDEGYQASVCPIADGVVGTFCRSPATSSLTLHNDAAQSQVAQLLFVDPDTTTTATDLEWTLVSSRPNVGTLFVLDETTGMLSTSSSAADKSVKAGNITLQLRVRMMPVTSASIKAMFTLNVEITDDCFNQNCSGNGVCADRVNDFFCTCSSGFEGKTCASVVVSTSSEEPIIEIVEENAASAGVSGGGVAGIVIGLLVLILLLVGVVMFVQHRKEQNRVVLSSLVNNKIYESGSSAGSMQYETVQSTGVVFDGGSNPMYGTWYRADMGKEAAYGVLSTSQPGTFIIRDVKIDGVRNPLYCLHVKTPSQIIRDVNIDGTPGAMSLLDVSNAPKFAELSNLVDHYSTPTDQPFVLNSVTMIQGMELYDNANISNKAVQSSVVPMKMSTLRNKKSGITAVAPGLSAI